MRGGRKSRDRNKKEIWKRKVKDEETWAKTVCKKKIEGKRKKDWDKEEEERKKRERRRIKYI